MVSKQERNIDLPKLNKLGAFQMQLEGEIYTAPFSQKSCVWFEWIHSMNRPPSARGYTFGYGTGHESSITAKGTSGCLTVYPDRIMVYLAPSFGDKVIVDGKEQYIKEFCFEPDQSYYALVEEFIYHPPPFRFFPLIPRWKATWLLALSYKSFEEDCPLHPLIPAGRGMTG
jgi:hypothetical protein